MTRPGLFKAVLVGSVCSATLLSAASARNFTIPGGDLESALTAYSQQSGIGLIVSDDQVKGIRTKGASGDMSDDAALARILSGTGFVVHRHSSGKIGIARDEQSANTIQSDFAMQLAQAAPSPRAAVETVTVTSSKLGGADVQSIPIAITALSQEQLTATQTAGGPDLVKQVPNLTFTKTNFTGYSIQIRGIGTQAISVATDPAVAVAMNDIPFIRNHFFEQEFYDVAQVEVLRGPQGTLYGRNATAGVVNLATAKLTDQFEAMASADIGNYHNHRFEGMINLPIVDDRLDIRVAGEWTKRDGYSFNSYTNTPIDGRDLWSGRVTIGMKPVPKLQAYLVWEHFQEDDDRLRSGKQLCKTDYGPGGSLENHAVNINGVTMGLGPGFFASGNSNGGTNGDFFVQGCVPTSLYSRDAFQAPLGYGLPYIIGPQGLGGLATIDPYASEFQSPNLRVINSSLNPVYRAKNDTVEFNADYALAPQLTFTSQTGFNEDFLWSTEDFNRFGAAPGLFGTNSDGSNVQFCDPQLGCSDRLVAEDLSDEHAWQLSQEFRLASKFDGPFNFSLGGNYLHYETLEDYYVFLNTITWFLIGGTTPYGHQYQNLSNLGDVTYLNGYVDPTPLDALAGDGHNYYRNENPYVLNSYAAFGEVYYNITSDLKLTGGLRWTNDHKHFSLVPSWIVDTGYGYPIVGVVDQQWSEFTGRAVANWTPKLDFTSQTLIYASYAHGYKAGGANPPGAIFDDQGPLNPVHPLTFKPEFVDAYELGTKNTLLDGAITLNGDIFFYNYKGYQISEIVDRTAINHNYDATVRGAELETTWEPTPGLKFSFAGGYEATRIDDGQYAVDLMDRTAGVAGWYIAKPFVTQASNCIFPGYVAQYLIHGGGASPGPSACALAYLADEDPLTGKTYKQDPTVCLSWFGGSDTSSACPPGYPGFDPSTAPNDGEGFSKDLSGNELPNAPHFTTSLSADYTVPVSDEWAATLHSDFYWQAQSWWRVFNDSSYDRLHGYTNVNLALILNSSSGWQVMGYAKNIFNTTAITGAFLNSDDTGLTTNVFLSDPRLYGVRITKNW